MIAQPPAGGQDHRAARLTLGLFFITTLVAPAALINKLVFLVLGLWLLKDMLFARRPALTLSMGPLGVFAIFAYGLFLSLMFRADVGLAIQLFLSVFILFLVEFIDRYRIDLDPLVEVAGIVLLIFTALLWLVTLWPDMPLGEPLRDLFERFSLSSQSERDFLEDPIFSLRVGTVPFLFLPWCLLSRRFFHSHRWRDLLLLVLTAVGIALSASRGLIVVSLVFLVVVAMGRLPLLARVAAAIGVGLAAYIAFEVYLSSTPILNPEEISNAVKIGHFKSYFDNVTLASAAFGRGLAAYYYSSGSAALKAQTEISPLDMLRYFGVPLTVLLYGFLLFPARKLSRYGGGNAIHVFTFALYLVLSMTNPVLFNSFGMLVVLWYWSKIRGGSNPALQPAGRVPV